MGISKNIGSMQMLRIDRQIKALREYISDIAEKNSLTAMAVTGESHHMIVGGFKPMDRYNCAIAVSTWS
jgi:hypothetical protein